MSSNRNREQRRLQRLRGAGTRQIKDVDFDLGFPSAPIQPLRRSPRTPKPTLPAQRSTGRTSVPKTSRSKEITAKTTKSSTPKASPISIDADTSTKRRRTQKPFESNPFSSAKTSRSQGRSRNDLYEDSPARPAEQRISEEKSEEIDELGGQFEFAKSVTAPRPTVKNSSSRIAVEVVIDGSKKSLGSEQIPQTDSSKKSALGASFQSALIDATPNFKAKTRATLDPDRNNTKLNQGSSYLDEVDELSPDQHEKGESSREQISGQNNEQEQEEAEPIDDIEAATYLSRKRKRGSPSEIERAAEGLEQYKPSKPKPTKNLSQRRKVSKPSPVAQRQPKTRKASASRPVAARETVPVVVHRLTKGPVYEEDDPNTDILNADIPFARRSGVSTVDVLAQFCDEMIESGLEALEEGGSNAEDQAVRREYRTKLRAVEGFQEELRTRLLELAILLDTDYLLHKRVRAAQKERIRLREDLLRIRAERERIALEMDEVRIKYESSNKKAQEQTALSASLHSIEVAVSLGIEKTPLDKKPTLNLPSLLKTVASDVSNKSSAGGILSQVRNFNDFLERAALALEGMP